MDQIKLSDDVFEQIKDFNNYYLTGEQLSLIDKLITDKKLKNRYRNYGLCKDCMQPRTGALYCRKRGFGTTFKAVWKDGPWGINFDNKQWERKVDTKVALKCLNNSQDITADFLKEVESNILVYSSAFIVRCFGITKDPKTENFMMSFRGLEDDIDKLDSVIYEQVKETDDINKKLYFSSPLKSTGTISYMTHPQAVYTSRLLDFKNLPEPKNADNNDDLHGIEYSDSLKMDFTKLDINSKDETN
ncbi:uncharacterized protein OCT59_005786 [Rhizophagus irregularis]|uniref:uncharacterized protein n=1 Tax=Rhizophagus irregularis TaxID=588596 RepID=UPI00331705E8|nr:hypothetical protein OCT59_005786 [Rhizophagus irregularis]